MPARLFPRLRVCFKSRHYRRQLLQRKTVFRIVNPQTKPRLHQCVQRFCIRQMDLLLHMTVLPVGKVEVGQRQFAAVRQMAAHQQMVAEMRLRPVRRPEVAHHVIAEILRREVKMVHRLPVFVMVELQRPLIPFMHQTIAAVRRLLRDIGQQLDRRGQRLAAEADVGDPALPRHLHQR